ncbi:dehydrogenase/reductase SDR family member 4-like [Chiloscyllium plagiosum]|uniref:dehydrogenase/reductase SDR family member 4-like n=2 Tax=Chiloscyllium plagiosum TaxID=36176 RepID=UPI001CB7D3C3|nr:dehydrogenase/reductase SDR family member 4-like [Chiloscyllium plagiosum]
MRGILLPDHCRGREIGLDSLILATVSSSIGLARLAERLEHFLLSFPKPQTMQLGVLSGKVAMVTASTQGIGLAIARRLARDGAQVVISSRKKESVCNAVGQLQAEGLSVSGTVCHVGKREDCEALVSETLKRHGAIDILVSNAAANPFAGKALDCSEEAWDKTFEINVKAAFRLSKLVVPYMEQRGGGSIVLVSSAAGYQPFATIGPYSVSKTALLGLTKVLATEVAPANIRVNCLAPGIIKTKFSSALWSDDSLRQESEGTIAMRRIGEPEECAGTVSFLCSQDAAYITGETIVVAGGLHCRL